MESAPRNLWFFALVMAGSLRVEAGQIVIRIDGVIFRNGHSIPCVLKAGIFAMEKVFCARFLVRLRDHF